MSVNSITLPGVCNCVHRVSSSLWNGITPVPRSTSASAAPNHHRRSPRYSIAAAKPTGSHATCTPPVNCTT